MSPLRRRSASRARSTITNFPIKSIEFCLKQAGLDAEQLDYVGFYDKPFLKFERLLETYLAYAPAGFQSFLKAMPLWLRQKLHLPREMNRGLNHQYRKRYVFTEHHESHAASAFFPSPFEEAAILTLDGVGEWATASWGYGRGNRIQLATGNALSALAGPALLGVHLLHGLHGQLRRIQADGPGALRRAEVRRSHPGKADRSEGRRLVPHGHVVLQLLPGSDDDLARSSTDLFGGPPRKPDTLLTQRDMDIAASIQKVTEEIMLRSARHVHEQTGMKNLCLAGGVALNCVANGRILREGPFDDIWIQPAAGDAGGALGVALFIWHQLLNQPRTPAANRLAARLAAGSDVFRRRRSSNSSTRSGPATRSIDDDQQLCDHIADQIAAGNVIGWFQGPMEFGPRALGSRSLLGDPRNPDMQTVMNVKVKFREGFRPFAPAVLAERAHEYFDVEPDQDSPYMLLVAPVRDEKRCPLTAEDRSAAGHRQAEDAAIRSAGDHARRLLGPRANRRSRAARLVSRRDRVVLPQDRLPGDRQHQLQPGLGPDRLLAERGLQHVHGLGHRRALPGPFRARRRPSSGHSFRPKRRPRSMRNWPMSGAARMRRASCGSKRDHLVCEKSGQTFPVTDGIPQLFWPHEKFNSSTDVTEIVKAFYEETPFPNYDDHDSVRSLIEKSRRGLYARVLDESIPYNSDVLEVGCGTGQLTNFLGISCRRVIGTDMCLNSLRLAENFRREHGLNRVRFVQMNLFKPCFKPEQFDVVLCNGVLHHTADPWGGFRIDPAAGAARADTSSSASTTRMAG